MRNIFRVILILLAVLVVSLLGYTAYSLMSKTLVYPFVATEKQTGYGLQFVVAPPKLAKLATDPLLDEAAIRSSIKQGDTLLDPETVSGEYRIDVSPGGHARIERITPKKNDPSITIDADTYNERKTTLYKFPRDITFTPTDAPMDIIISREGEPRDQLYTVEMYGFPDVRPTDIRYYAHYIPTADCSIMSWGRPVYQIDPTKSLDMSSGSIARLHPSLEWIYQEVVPEVIMPSTQNGQKWQAKVKLPYQMSESRLCIIAGVGGNYRIVEDRLSAPFTATGRLSEPLSPLHDMKSQIEIEFSEYIYSDTGALYSPEYIANRREAKIEFLKHLDIAPYVALTDADVMLTPDRAVITLPLAVATDYEVKLRDIADIYGRTTSLDFPVRIESEAFLSLLLSEKKQIYTTMDTIDAKVYALKTEKNAYTLKLCNISLDQYARAERMLTNQSRAKNTMISEILTTGRECRTREIILSGSGVYSTPFRIDDFFAGEKKPGLYILSFSEKDLENYSVVSGEKMSVPRFLPPIIFALVDTHITMKVDASGKMMFLATDILTGKPRGEQSITLARNVSRTHTEKWNPGKQVVEKEYIPLASQGFATGVIIGRTDGAGYVDTKVDTLKGIEGYDSSPYSLAFDSWWDYEGRYDSFLVESRGEGHLGYLVSTWNDGITGYNFGIKDSDYSYQSRGRYTSYLHTERRLYLPGETVHIHTILRENSASLTIPTGTAFDLVITDPLGREVKRGTYKSNDFGAISLDYPLSKDATLGMYTMSLSVPDSTDYIENAYANFQVEVFKNPTFTASVELKSDDLEDGSIKNLRKIKNTDIYSPWYTDVYSRNMTIEGVVRARYYNGAEMKNMPFTYRVYRSVSYPEEYWGDCFWGCYYEPPLDLYTEGSGSIDSDGYGIMRIPVEYQSAYDDYTYTVEVTIRDELSGESVTSPGSLTVKLPIAYKFFNPDNPLRFTPKKKILTLTDSLIGSVKPLYGNWDMSLANKYRYELIRRDYDEIWVEDIRTGETRVTTSKDATIMTGSIEKEELTLKLAGSKPGEYHLRIIPDTDQPPESSISDTIFYITGGPVTLRDSTLRVIPERTIYRAGETARVMIQVPFTGSYLLITKEKGGVIDREYTYLSGNTLTREYEVDGTLMPNAYIGVVALKPGSPKVGGKSYAVGYAEIITDIADKKSLLTVKPDKDIYKNRETANLDITLTDRSGSPLEGEVTLMVIDESLIRILGNIDLDILPKFYQKFPFTVKTVLSAIGIERGQYLSRKGSSGGGGNKGGEGVAISSRTIFENTAYYNPSILTDKNGHARVSFPLPDNITDYRIIAIANTKDSQFSVAEKNLSVRKDYVIEPYTPTILYGGDTTTFTFEVFNATKRITDAEVVLRVGTGSGSIEKKSPISLGSGEKKGVDFSISLPVSWSGQVNYTVELREKAQVLDALTKSVSLLTPPILSVGTVDIRIWTGKTLSYSLPPMTLSGGDLSRSRVEVSLSDSFLPEFERGLTSLLQYPYGCIEQMIASTLPNRVALSVADAYGLSIDRENATKNVSDGLAKILRMQHISGGWTYWEGSSEPDARITPYVVRTLLKFRELGETIPSTVLETAVSYIFANEGIYREDMDNFAEATWTLALAGESKAIQWWEQIDPKRLSRHGYVAYVSAASKLGKYTSSLEQTMRERLSSENAATWYWNTRTDKALFAQLLYSRGDREKALTFLYPLMGTVDVASYYTSTQEKIQYLLALIAESKFREKIKNPQSIALRGNAIIADLSLSAAKPSSSFATTRSKVGEGYTLKREATTPLILITRIHDVPTNIIDLPYASTGGIDISRVYELVDESAGVDQAGQYRQASLVKDGVFLKGRLYRVRLTATLSSMTDEEWSHLAIEDFFPGAYRPINKTFNTESHIIQNQQDENWWSYAEARDDRILAHLMYGWGSRRTYTYYFRPERIGDYLLPPATAYFMYDPDRHAYTGFSRMKVVE